MAQKRITKFDPIPASSNQIRVAAYCRISTLHEEQLSSIENQEEHYKTLIAKHPDWINAGIYVDEGITGTKKEIRPELNRMLMNCRTGKIDLILTKSISRFARNTTDCLQMVRSLSRQGVDIVFEKENIDTRRTDDEFLLTILSSLAEEESHSISSNEKWSIQKRMQDGTFHQSKAPYGYRWSNGTNGELIPDPIEASVVQWIFGKVLSGCGTSMIAKELNKAKIPSPQNEKWSSYTVGFIVKNPAVIGDVLMNKSYINEAFHRRRNFGEKPMYYQDRHHEAIISQTDFENANAAMAQRGKEKGNYLPVTKERVKHQNPHQNHYPFTGKLICGECGSTFRRMVHYSKTGNTIFWTCTKHHVDSKACSMKWVREENVQNAFLTMIHKLQYAPFILDDYCESLKAERLATQDRRLLEIQNELKQNMEKQNRLAQILQSGCYESVSYYQETIKLEEEAAKLKCERNGLLENKDSPADGFRSFVKNFSSATGNTADFPAEAFTEHVQRVIIHSQTCFTFVLKCGLELKEDCAVNQKAGRDLSEAKNQKK